ncbi:MAG: ABC transporter substrate-binding protein [Pseudolabrys sp.]
MAVRGARAATWKIADNLLGAATPADATPWFAAFVKRLGELGWIDGSTIAIEYRWAESRGERYAEIAAELVKLKVDVIVTWASAPVLAAKRGPRRLSRSSLPRRWIRSAPVSSLAWRVRAATSPDCRSSRPIRPASVLILREVVPGLRRLAIIANVDAAGAVIETREIAATARALNLDVILLEIQRVEDIAPAIEALKTRADALYVATDPVVLANWVRTNALARGARLPTIYGGREYVEAGALMSYGPSWPHLFRRAAEYVDKILRGAKLGDIPVEQPTKFRTGH